MFPSRSAFFPLLLLFSCTFAIAQTPVNGDLKKKRIPDTILGHRTLFVHGPFDAWKVLRKLFPGQYYELPQSTGKPDRLISWIYRLRRQTK